jgi:hypothetical protein
MGGWQTGVANPWQRKYGGPLPLGQAVRPGSWPGQVATTVTCGGGVVVSAPPVDAASLRMSANPRPIPFETVAARAPSSRTSRVIRPGSTDSRMVATFAPP